MTSQIVEKKYLTHQQQYLQIIKAVVSHFNYIGCTLNISSTVHEKKYNNHEYCRLQNAITISTITA